MASSLTDDLNARIARQGMTPRQQELNRKWAFYKTQQYDARMTTWDGHRVLTDVEREAAAFSQVMPSGYWDPFQRFDEVPLAMRKPSAPYHLVRVVVNKFTELLFSAKMHPQVQLLGDPKGQAWIDGLIKASRLWIRMAYARTFGGAMGSVAMTFQFRNGRPFIEVHDSRWCTPTFRDQATGELAGLEIRYQFPRDEYNERTGELVENWYWYRRIIDEEADVVFQPALVDPDGREPQWIEQSRVAHNLGEFPGVWIRNTLTDELDGEADCEGEYDTQETVDTLLSQGTQGAVENCDPTLAVVSNEIESDKIRKGSFDALKLEQGGSASYVEMSGSGTDAAIKMFEVHRKNFLEVVQCVLESEVSAMTATEIERRYSSMHARGDMFREQYGEMGIKPLVGKMVRAVRKLAQGTIDQTSGVRVIGQVFLSPKVENGQLVNVEMPANLDGFTDDHIEIKWPEWVKRGPTDAQAAAGAVSTARTAQVIDKRNAVEYLAPYFSIEDTNAAISELDREQQMITDNLMGEELLAARQSQQQQPDPSQQQQQPAPGAAPADAGKVQDTALNGAQVTAALEICAKVATREIAPEAAKLMLVEFGLVDDVEVANRMVQAQLTAQPPAPTGPPFGGGGFPR